MHKLKIGGTIATNRISSQCVDLDKWRVYWLIPVQVLAEVFGLQYLYKDEVDNNSTPLAFGDGDIATTVFIIVWSWSVSAHTTV